MIEEWRTNPIVVELIRRVQGTQSFLKMAAIELRRIAERAPEVAVELRHVARQMDAEAVYSLAAIPNDNASADTQPSE